MSLRATFLGVAQLTPRWHHAFADLWRNSGRERGTGATDWRPKWNVEQEAEWKKPLKVRGRPLEASIFSLWNDS
jgi:hypothetical protein